ncbi:hypothetical protein [Hymenobacter canadensis]|uniref:Uncharacterized protein n=1 Tax=Hymenobacter canadensis TaxID=2999067 RepID=A0ABY7LLS8_9BACT|nr:hypothetical protein [Hymenobacter canadensis]WBA40402.1 hypothetical protein O3303_11220 [Hymenobacter canadensis]
MENDEKTPHNATPDSAAPAAADNSNSVVGSEASRADLSSTQASFQDPDRLENQQSSPERGEFGPHGHLGHTHGGYGNQARNLTPEPAREAAPPSDTTAHHDGYQVPQGNGDNGLGMGSPTSQQNDNGSEVSNSEGYSADYGNTSGGSPLPAEPQAAAGTTRNQHEDDHSSRGGYDNQGHSDDSNYRQPAPGAAAASAGEASAEDEAGRPAAIPEEANAGAGSSYSGSTQDGHGSRGGSYNDEYDAANDNSQTGSPARGDYDSQDQSQNYGQQSRQENRPAGEKDTDHGATPKRTGTQE